KLRQRHADYFLAYAERARPELSAPHAAEWLNRLELRTDDLRAALSWFAERDDPGESEKGLRLSGALWPFWHARYDMGDASMRTRNNVWLDAVVWLERLLAGNPPTCDATANALLHLAILAFRSEKLDRAKELFEQSLAMCESIGDLATAATTLLSFSGLYA